MGKNIRPVLDKRYKVTTCGIAPIDDIKINLAKEIPVLDKHYDVVLHACGKAHSVPKTEAEKQVLFCRFPAKKRRIKKACQKKKSSVYCA